MIKKLFFISVSIVLLFSCFDRSKNEEQIVQEVVEIEKDIINPGSVDEEEKIQILSVIKDPMGFGFESELDISLLQQKIGIADNIEKLGESEFGTITNHTYSDLIATDVGNSVKMIEFQSDKYLLRLDIKVGDSINHIAEVLAAPQWRDSTKIWSYMYDQYALTFFFNSDGVVEKIVWNWGVT